MTKTRQAAVVLTLCAGAIGVASPAAQAHVVADSGYAYASDTNCTHLRAEISDGGFAAGYFKADTRSDYKTLDFDCTGDLRRGPGYIRTAWTAYKLVNGAWSYCKSSGYQYNSVSGDKMVASANWQNPVCGQGTYTMRTQGHVYNGTWYGGSWGAPGTHYLYNGL